MGHLRSASEKHNTANSNSNLGFSFYHLIMHATSLYFDVTTHTHQPHSRTNSSTRGNTRLQQHEATRFETERLVWIDLIKINVWCVCICRYLELRHAHRRSVSIYSRRYICGCAIQDRRFTVSHLYKKVSKKILIRWIRGDTLLRASVQAVTIMAGPSETIPNYVNTQFRGSSITIITLIFSSISLVVVLLRYYTRIHLLKSFGSDDVFIGAAMVRTTMTADIRNAEIERFRLWTLPLQCRWCSSIAETNSTYILGISHLHVWARVWNLRYQVRSRFQLRSLLSDFPSAASI